MNGVNKKAKKAFWPVHTGILKIWPQIRNLLEISKPDGSCRRPIKDFQELRMSVGPELSELSELPEPYVPGSLAACLSPWGRIWKLLAALGATSWFLRGFGLHLGASWPPKTREKTPSFESFGCSMDFVCDLVRFLIFRASRSMLGQVSDLETDSVVWIRKSTPQMTKIHVWSDVLESDHRLNTVETRDKKWHISARGSRNC